MVGVGLSSYYVIIGRNVRGPPQDPGPVDRGAGWLNPRPAPPQKKYETQWGNAGENLGSEWPGFDAY